MNFKQTLYKLYSGYVRKFKKGLIVSRPMEGLNKELYFQSDQYINFFRNSIISHEEKIKCLIGPLIKSGDIVYDVGANIGQYTMFFSECVDTEGKVISFEPDVQNYSLLVFNKLRNSCDNVTTLNMGVGDKTQEKVFYSDRRTGGRTSSFIEDYVKVDGEKPNRVTKITTLTNIQTEYGVPSLIKIDVEGFEALVLLGLSDISNDTSFMIEVRSNTKDEVFSFFEDKNFSCWYLDGLSPKQILVSSDIPGFSNLFFTKRLLPFS